jgi:hypothetical protein
MSYKGLLESAVTIGVVNGYGYWVAELGFGIK